MTNEELLYMATSMTAFRSKEERDEYMKPKGFAAKHPLLSLALIIVVGVSVFKIAMRVLQSL